MSGAESGLVRVSGEGTAAQETLVGFRTAEHPRLDAVQNAISALCAVVAGAALVAIVVITGVEVVTRSVFSHPLGWNVGLVEEYLMTALAFFGMVTAYRSSAHIAVATVYERLPEPTRKAVILLGQAVIAFALVWLVVAGADSARFAFATSEQPVPGSAELPLPSGLGKSILPVGAFLGLVLVLIDLYRELTGGWRGPVTDYAASDVVRETEGVTPVAGATAGGEAR